MERRFYTPQEVADLLSVSKSHVLNLIHRDRLFAVRISERVYRIPVGALDRLGVEPRVSIDERDVDGLMKLGEDVPEPAAAE